MFKILGTEPKNKDIYFKLEYDEEDVLLVACNSDGVRLTYGNILKITKAGCLVRIAYINKNIDLTLDKEGRIVEE